MSRFDFVVRQEEAYLRLLHPTPDDIPGCISLFDTYLSCNGMRWIKHCQVLFQSYPQVIRSQVKAIYRYGGRPVCGDKLEDFKFCMSIKSMHPEERRDAWIRRRAEWWAHRRMTKSSEDIWDIRS
jgi:hypothetical protein